MTYIAKDLIRAAYLSLLWLLVLELSELNWEACEVSSAEIHLQCKIEFRWVSAWQGLRRLREEI
ncbi:MAG: hypothetical protein AAGJ95_10385 [Cyanobacteria bacterium J06554_11]